MNDCLPGWSQSEVNVWSIRRRLAYKSVRLQLVGKWSLKNRKHYSNMHIKRKFAPTDIGK